MPATDNRKAFLIWGVDQAVYGPVELPTLVAWIKDERVFADTWIHSCREGTWRKAADVPELQSLFQPNQKPAPPDTSLDSTVLRHFKVFASLDDAQLAGFARFLEAEPIKQGTVLVKQGDQGDAMYLILGGELRVRTQAAGRETILATLGLGDFFGDIALFDQGPRPADVVANVDSTVLKLTATGFEKLARQAPELAAPFLLSTIRTLVARIRADNKRLRDSVNLTSADGQ